MKDTKARNDQQKEKEVRALEAARSLGASIPNGEIVPYERPDLKIETENGTVGIEVTEALLPARNGPFRPVEEESFHKEVIKLAEEIYRSSGALPVQVHVYWNGKGRRYRKQDMASKLAEFVEANRPQVTSVAAFPRKNKHVPEGFGQIIIALWPAPWTNGESYGLSVSEIYKELASKITAKNKLLPDYRARLPGSAIWLLVYSGVEITRGLWAPHGIGEEIFAFAFEKVLFLSCLSNQVVVLRNR